MDESIETSFDKSAEEHQSIVTKNLRKNLKNLVRLNSFEESEESSKHSEESMSSGFNCRLRKMTLGNDAQIKSYRIESSGRAPKSKLSFDFSASASRSKLYAISDKAKSPKIDFDECNFFFNDHETEMVNTQNCSKTPDIKKKFESIEKQFKKSIVSLKMSKAKTENQRKRKFSLVNFFNNLNMCKAP